MFSARRSASSSQRRRHWLFWPPFFPGLARNRGQLQTLSRPKAPRSEDDDVQTDVVEGADSPLVDEAGPCGSNEAEVLLSVVWRQIFEETDTKTRKKEKNRSQRRKTKKMAERNQHEGKLNAPMSHLIAVASYWTCTCQRLLTSGT